MKLFSSQLEHYFKKWNEAELLNLKPVVGVKAMKI
jgi:hypothetical protein